MTRIVAFCLIAMLMAGRVFAAPAQTLLIYGDSLSAGYGLNINDAWPSLIRAKLPGGWQLVNASQSGETTDGGRSRLAATLSAHKPALVVIELGANDGLRGLSLDTAEKNLADMIEQSQRSGAQVLLIAMQLPPNFGKRYTEQFASMYDKLAKRYQLVPPPFLFDGIADKPDLFQPDQLHPGRAAQATLANTVWRSLAPLLSKKARK